MSDNIIIVWVSVLSIILTIILYFIELQKKVKYPLLTIFLALFITSILVLFLRTPENKQELTNSTNKNEDKKVIKNDSISKLNPSDLKIKLGDSPNIMVAQTFKENYYYSNFYDYKIIFLRNRPLTKEEINTCNKCLTYTRNKEGKNAEEGQILTNEETIYQDLNNPNCKIKKKLDDETGIGYISTGVVVELIETRGNFSHIKVVSNGVEGWISSKLQGKPTLLKRIDESSAIKK